MQRVTIIGGAITYVSETTNQVTEHNITSENREHGQVENNITVKGADESGSDGDFDDTDDELAQQIDGLLDQETSTPRSRQTTLGLSRPNSPININENTPLTATEPDEAIPKTRHSHEKRRRMIESSDEEEDGHLNGPGMIEMITIKQPRAALQHATTSTAGVRAVNHHQTLIRFLQMKSTSLIPGTDNRRRRRYRNAG